MILIRLIGLAMTTRLVLLPRIIDYDLGSHHEPMRIVLMVIIVVFVLHLLN